MYLGYNDFPSVGFKFTKERKIISVGNVLAELGYSYRKIPAGISTSGKDVYKINVHKGGSKAIKSYADSRKSLPKWFWSLSNRQFELFWREYIRGDGTVGTGDHKNMDFLYCSKPEWVDAFQTRLFATGYKTNVYWKEPGQGAYKSTRCAQINIRRAEWHEIRKAEKVRLVDYHGKKWCAQVKNGTLVVRRNNKITITQNSHKSQHYSQRLHLKRVPHAAYGIGCLCNVDPSWKNKMPTNFINSFAIVEYRANGNFNVHETMIIDGEFSYDRHTWRA